MSAKTKRHNARSEALQMALVMTGGVSLAIWMGGVTNEIYRLYRKDGPYGRLLELTDTEPRIDVISGTSAGGLNGVLLAAAIASNLPTDRFEDIRRVWLNAGSLRALLRSPFDKKPPSLLKGDEYLETQIRDVLEGWLGNSGIAGEFPEEEDFQLRLTGTLLDGEVRAFPDDFGEVIHDKKHDVIFRFSRQDMARPTIARELSLAARTSASFPVAFEPSVCSLSDEPKSSAPLSMAHCLSVRTLADKVALIDGGVLLNKPLRPALEAIKEASPLFNSRRVLAYIVPDPTEPAETEDGEEETTTIWKAIAASVVKIPASQSIYRDLDEVRRYQNRMRDQNRFREQLIQTASTAPLDALATSLYRFYRNNRGESSVARSIGFLMSRTLPQGRNQIDNRTGDKQLADFEVVRSVMKEARMSWLPRDEFPGEAYFARNDWPWGIASIEYLISLERELLKRSAAILGMQRNPDAHDKLDDLAGTLDAESRRINAVRALDKAYWRSQKEAFWRMTDEVLVAEVLAEWAKNAYDEWPTGDRGDEVHAAARRVCAEYKLRLKDPCSLTAKKTRGLSLKSARSLVEVLFGLRAVMSPVVSADEDNGTFVGSMLSQLLPDEAAEQPRDEIAFVLRKMIALFVVQVALQGAQEPGSTMKLMQVCANMSTAVDGTRSSASQKLTGTQLGHFGALFKPSWRANDFMWGRLDAVERLTRMLLEPDRLVELGKSKTAVLEEIEELATGTYRKANLSDGDRRHLEDVWIGCFADAVREELAFLDDAAKKNDRPQCLRKSAEAIAYALQVEILQRELPVVAGEVAQSAEQGANKDSGSAFRGEVEMVYRASRGIPASEACRLLRMCKIGEERLISHEIGHDLFANTAIEAGAVLTSAARGSRPGCNSLTSLFGSIYWGLIIPIFSWIRLGTAKRRGSRIAAVVLSVLISVSLTILVIRLMLPVEVPGLLLIVSGVILFAWIVGSVSWAKLKRTGLWLKSLLNKKQPDTQT